MHCSLSPQGHDAPVDQALERRQRHAEQSRAIIGHACDGRLLTCSPDCEEIGRRIISCCDTRFRAANG